MEAGYPKPEIARHFDFIDAELGQRDYFVGDDFSMADIQMFYAVEAGLGRGAGSRPNATAWLNRVKAREAYKRAVEKGGPAVPAR